MLSFFLQSVVGKWVGQLRFYAFICHISPHVWLIHPSTEWIIGAGLCIFSPWTVSRNKLVFFKTKKPRSFAQMHGQKCYWLRMTCGSVSLGSCVDCVDLFFEILLKDARVLLVQVDSLEFRSLRINLSLHLSWKLDFNRSFYSISQMLNVWYIYLHVPPNLPKCR